MRSVLTVMLVLFVTMGLAVNDAAAKRFGGARFSGGQRTKSALSSLFAKKKTQSIKSNSTSQKSSGFFRGLLMGGLFASLFMGHGITSMLILSMLGIALLVFIVNRFKNKTSPRRI